MSLQEQNILVYIGGFIVRRVTKKACPECCEKITSQICADDSSHDFIAAKQLEGVKVRLVVPSKVVTESLQKMEVEYTRHVESVIRQKHVKAALLALMLECVDEQLVCDTCNLHQMISCLMVNIRLFHSIRLANAELRDKHNRKNRKALKFAHM